MTEPREHGAVLDRNIELLLTRAWRPRAPSDALRAATVRAARSAARRAHGSTAATAIVDRRTMRLPAYAAAFAAAVLLGVVLLLLSDRVRPPSTRDAVLASGAAAVREAPGGPWREARDVEVARGAYYEAATPEERGLVVRLGDAEAAARVSAAPDGAFALRRAGGRTTVALERGALELSATAPPARVETSQGILDVGPGGARVALEWLDAGDDRFADARIDRPVVRVRPHGDDVAFEGVALAPGRDRFLQDGRLLEPVATAVAQGGRTDASAPPDPVTTDAAAGDADGDGVAAERAITGTVLDAGGAPLHEFVVWTKPLVELPNVAETVAHRVRGAADGRFRAPVDADAPHLVLVEAAGHVAWRAPNVAVGASLDVRLRRGVALAGHVVDHATGAPVEGALVYVESGLAHDVVDVHGSELDPLPRATATTDASGAFRIEDVGLGPQRLRASRRGYAPTWSSGLEVVDPGRDATDAPRTVRLAAPLALRPGGHVEGVVERPDGSAWSGAQVVIALRPESRERPPMTYGAATTGPDGAYAVHDLPPGIYVAILLGDEADGTGAFQRILQTRVRRDETTRVDFLSGAESATLRGVLRAPDGAPVVGRSVLLVPVPPPGTHSGEIDWIATETDADGRFAFTELEPGPVALYRTDGFGQFGLLWRGDVGGVGPSPPIVFDLAETLVTVAVDSAGTPVEGCTVRLERFEPSTRAWFFAGEAITDGDGTVEWRRVLPGRYRSLVRPADPLLGHAVVEPFDVHPTEPVRRRVALARAGALEVVVLGADGAPVSEGPLALLEAGGREVFDEDDFRPAPDGARRLGSLAPGPYVLRVGRGPSAVERAIEIRADDTTRAAVRSPR